MLKDILSIAGHGGLFKFVSQGRNGIIVENLETKARMNAHASAKVSALEDISIFTETGDVPLKDVMKAIFEKENGGETINHKSGNEELKSYLREVLPEYDEDRVYVSDMKKIFQWYNLLHKFELLNFEEEEEETAESDKETETEKKTEEKDTEQKESKE